MNKKNDYKALLKDACELVGYLTAQRDRAAAPDPLIDSWIAEKIAALSSQFHITPNDDDFEGCESAPVDTAGDDESALDEAVADSTLTEERLMADEDDATPAEPLAPTIGDAPAPRTVNDEAAPAAESLEDKLARRRAADLATAFTLNDRFRFRRELFRNSAEEMAEAINVISQMSTITEAEEYIFEDLCLDPDNEAVKDFMDIIARHF